MNNIDFALVEEKRPPMYTAMKYWGKKPHNIWGKYIENYTPQNGKILDPFSGSAIAAFEAVKAGKKAVAFDINPLTSFIINVYSEHFDESKYREAVYSVISNVRNDHVYQKFYTTTCKHCGNKSALLQHFKWDGGKIYEFGVDCKQCNQRYLLPVNKEQADLAIEMKSLNIPYWYPKDKFYESPSFTSSFIKNIGGNSFDNIWTRRNLYVLSKLFDEILKQTDEVLKKQLLFAFIQCIHLSSKMCVPRREKSNRSFSTSWGRSAYICSLRQMEMNPLMLFESNSLGKQSAKSALSNVKEHIGKVPKSVNVDQKSYENETEYDIIYGKININNLLEYLPNDSIDFIITDPPYGGLVQYADLSNIWLVWLKHYDIYYNPDIAGEITVKPGIQEIDEYSRRFTDGIKNLYNVLKPNGKIVFTFHNKDLKIWNAFLISISKAGFKIEKVIHQQNRRTGESNVANPYGTSASDFYIRCRKSSYVEKIKTSKEQFENFIVDRAISIIAARCEPTPYQILFNGLLSDISRAGFELENFDDNISEILEKHIGKEFKIIKTEKMYGNLWWLVNDKMIKSDAIPLSSRVEQTIKTLFKTRKSLSLDDVLAEIFVKYPNGLTPDIKKIDDYIKKYAYKDGQKWTYNKT